MSCTLLLFYYIDVINVIRHILLHVLFYVLPGPGRFCYLVGASALVQRDHSHPKALLTAVVRSMRRWKTTATWGKPKPPTP